MRTLHYIIALLGVVCLAPGCSDDPEGLTSRETSGDPSSKGDDGTTAPPPGKVEPTPVTTQSFGDTTLSRAREWIAADMPYCGGPNGGTDVICGGTCSRTGPSKNAQWDKYRSDCSGFVSWSWALPAPGHTTQTFAPYDTDVSSVINVSDLKPGDALNSSSHVMLFGGWVNEAAGTATILQESRCGTDAQEKTATFIKVDENTLKISDGTGRIFRPIRLKNAPQ